MKLMNAWRKKLKRGEILAIGVPKRTQKGGYQNMKLFPGDTVWVMPAIEGGLVIEHKDKDWPEIAELVPEGRELWIYRYSPESQILIKEVAA